MILSALTKSFELNLEQPLKVKHIRILQPIAEKYKENELLLCIELVKAFSNNPEKSEQELDELTTEEFQDLAKNLQEVLQSKEEKKTK